MGLVSLALTILNILSISIIAWLTLRLKEVTPEKIPQQFSSFWRKDVIKESMDAFLKKNICWQGRYRYDVSW